MRRLIGPSVFVRPVPTDVCPWYGVRARACCALLVVGVGASAVIAEQARAAETTDPVAMSKTLVVLTVDTKGPVNIRTTFTQQPPTLTIAFPNHEVASSLPERSAIATGPIQSITARYEERSRDPSRRFLKALEISLSAAYPYRVRSEPGRIVVEIQHPSSVGGAALDVGVRGGTIIGGLGHPSPTERFRAMQEAMATVTPVRWTFQLSETRAAALRGALGQAPAGPQPSEDAVHDTPQRRSMPASLRPGMSGRPTPPARTRSMPLSGAAWAFVVLAGALALGGGVWVRSRRSMRSRSPAARASGQVPSSGVALINQLLWRSFERQGYELIADRELTQPLIGTLRIIIKDGAKAALMFVGGGSFFERETVQRFLQLMRSTKLEEGFLAAPGSFTVPAQRLAKEHRVTLIGREQLTELLSVGARSESLTKQLAEQQGRLDEAKETLRQYAEELGTLRRQRNEASWFLGEERSRSGQLEAQIEALNQQLRHQEGELQRWEQEALAFRKRWEENEWYLGESRARAQHLETQMDALQSLAARGEVAERERHEAHWYLGEERARSEALEAQLADLHRRLEESVNRAQALHATLDQVQQELSSLRVHGERRRHARRKAPPIHVEVRSDQEEPVFTGSPRDLGPAGIGVESDRELPASPARIRLHLPGREPIDSATHLVWQRATASSPPRYQCGYQLSDLSDDTRELIEGIITQAPPTA